MKFIVERVSSDGDEPPVPSAIDSGIRSLGQYETLWLIEVGSLEELMSLAKNSCDEQSVILDFREPTSTDRKVWCDRYPLDVVGTLYIYDGYFE